MEFKIEPFSRLVGKSQTGQVNDLQVMSLVNDLQVMSQVVSLNSTMIVVVCLQ